MLAATQQLLAEVGYDDLTLALVAERAGTSRPALYRRWPSKAHLVYDALFPSPGDEITLDAPTFAGLLRSMVERIVASYRRPVARDAVPWLLAEIRDPQQRSSVVEGLRGRSRDEFAGRVDEAVRAGEVAAGTDPTLLLETLHAAALLHVISQDSVDASFPERLVDLLLGGAAPAGSACTSATGARAPGTRDRTVTTADGTRIAYRVGGHTGRRAPALVFVHGWCSNRTHWDAQLRYFAPTHRVLAVDRRGHGRSAVTASGYTPSRHAADLAAVLEHEGVDDLVLVAHAGGGPSAIRFADRHRARVRGLVLVDTNISGRTRMGRPHGADRSPLGRLVDQLDGPEGAARFEAMYRSFFSPHAGPVAETAVREAQAVPLRVARADLAALADDSEGPARRLTCPVLWLTVEPADTARLRSIFSDVRFAVVTGSGHFPHLEVPDQVDAAIGRFLATLTRESIHQEVPR